jgi:hypothetical protein
VLLKDEAIAWVPEWATKQANGVYQLATQYDAAARATIQKGKALGFSFAEVSEFTLKGKEKASTPPPPPPPPSPPPPPPPRVGFRSG